MGAETAVLPEWESFYVIIGTSAAALTGLQFVVITLVMESQRQYVARAISAFATPTVIHLSSIVLISGILSAPWETMTGPEVGMGAVGLGGLLYGGLTVWRILHQTAYKPVFEDWLWHVVLPIVAYSAALVAAFGLAGTPRPFLFLTAAAVLVLLFTGIHNSWDTVVFLAEGRVDSAEEANNETAAAVAVESRPGKAPTTT